MAPLFVNEVFYTIQGEGQSLGRRALFLRLVGCNLHCSFCDTPYTWAFNSTAASFHRDNQTHNKDSNIRRVEFSDMLEELLSFINRADLPLLVITGGEPMLQASQVDSFLTYCYDNRVMWPRIEIETAGTIWHKDLATWPAVNFNVSPKLVNSGNEESARLVPDVLTQFSKFPRASFKFVVSSEDDLKEITLLVERFNINPRQVWLMPEGIDVETLTGRYPFLVKYALQRGYNVTTRLHILIWGNQRGV